MEGQYRNLYGESTEGQGMEIPAVPQKIRAASRLMHIMSPAGIRP